MGLTATSEPELEGELLDACRRGDREALRRLFELYSDKVYSVAFHFTGDQQLARDVTQEIFVRVISRIGDFRAESSLTTWLYRIVANVCVDHRRAQWRLLPFGAAGRLRASGGPPPQERDYARKEISRAVHEAVARLKPELRLTILLRYVEGLSYEEIGQVLGCSTGTVGARLNRGHKILARKLAAFRGVTC